MELISPENIQNHGLRADIPRDIQKSWLAEPNHGLFISWAHMTRGDPWELRGMVLTARVELVSVWR